MRVDDSAADDSEENRRTCIKAGTSLVKYKPCFSKDSKFIFVAVDTSVKVYSTNTRECINIFSNDSGEIVSLFLNPHNYLQLVTVSNIGSVCYWDYEDAVLIREIKLSMTVEQCYSGIEPNTFFVQSKMFKLILVAIDIGTLSYTKQYLTSFNFDGEKGRKQMMSLNNDRSLGAIVVGNALHIRHLSGDLFNSKRHYISERSYFTCVEWHPASECIATGNQLGMIFLWYNYFDNFPIRSKLHWHSLPVIDLQFTPLGNFLYSGGSECVLVKWDVNTQERNFLPRLGLPICHVACSPDASTVSASLSENSIIIMDSMRTVQGVIKGLARSVYDEEFYSNPVPTGLLFDKKTSALVLNGKPGHLQFFNIREDKQIYDLDILHVNYIHAERNIKLYHLQVVKAAFNSRCDWLATVEYRNDHVTTPELRLKFWQYLESEKGFTLNTTIDTPHDDYINSLSFQPSDNKLCAVTTSQDGKYRIWAKYENEDMWGCQSVGFNRHLIPNDACFSEDGSILCVAFAQYLTLRLPEENVLLAALGNSSSKRDIEKVQFGRDDCSHILVCMTSDGISAWNTISCTELWHVELECCFLVGDPHSTIMAAFENKGNVFIFKPSDPNPIKIYKHEGEEKVIAAIFYVLDDEADQQSELVFMDAKQNLYTLADQELSSDNRKIQKMFGHAKAPLTPFGLLMAENIKCGIKKVEEKMRELEVCRGRKIIDLILTTQSHVLPSPTELCSAYLNLLIKDKEKKIKSKEKLPPKQTTTYNLRQTDERLTMVVDNSNLDGANAVATEDIDEENILEDYSWVNEIST